MRETKKIWMNGELVDWADATVHIGTHGLHYGSGVFEGIRAYETDRGTSVFRLTDHLERLRRSAQLLYMDLPYFVEELRTAAWDLIGANELAFATSGRSRSTATASSASRRALIPSTSRSCRGRGARTSARKACGTGSAPRSRAGSAFGPNVIPHAAKATGVYLNSMLAVGEANRAGYDEAILLTAEGNIADGSGESIFAVRDGVIYTPDLAASILVGITRDSVIQIAQDLGHRVVEKPLIRTDLYLADEVFMVGTAAEVTPIREIDDQLIGPPGPVTQEIQEAYLDTVHGRSERWSQWLEFTPPRRRDSGQRDAAATQREAAKADGGRSRSRGRTSASARKSSCSRCSARAGSRSGPRSTASRSCWQSASARRTRRLSRRAPPGCTCSCVAAGIGPGDEVITSPTRSPRARAASSTREGLRSSRTSIEPTLELDRPRWKRRSRSARGLSSRWTSSGSVWLDALARSPPVTALCSSRTPARRLAPSIVARSSAHTAYRASSRSMRTSSCDRRGGDGRYGSEDEWHLISSLRNQGRPDPGGWLEHARLGFNYRLSDVAAALGIAQLERLDQFLARRSQAATRYSALLREVNGLNRC